MERIGLVKLPSEQAGTLTKADEQQKKYSAWIIAKLTEMTKYLKNAEMTAETYKTYAKHLSDIRQPRLKAAFDRCLRELEFYPTIGKIRELSESHEESQTYIDPRKPYCGLCNGSKFRYTAVGQVVRCDCPKEAIIRPEVGTPNL
jgi:hypothetical protein